MLLQLAVDHDLYLIADEVYREFVYNGEALASFGQLGFGEENLILIDSVSKRFSACGARAARPKRAPRGSSRCWPCCARR